MAKNKTKKRLRKLRKAEKRQRRALEARPLGPGPQFPDAPPRWDERDWPRDDWDDPEGGAGVREPRRPWPTMPAAAIELDEPEPQYLDLTRRP